MPSISNVQPCKMEKRKVSQREEEGLAQVLMVQVLNPRKKKKEAKRRYNSLHTEIKKKREIEQVKEAAIFA